MSNDTDRDPGLWSSSTIGKNPRPFVDLRPPCGNNGDEPSRPRWLFWRVRAVYVVQVVEDPSCTIIGRRDGTGSTCSLFLVRLVRYFNFELVSIVPPTSTIQKTRTTTIPIYISSYAFVSLFLFRRFR